MPDDLRERQTDAWVRDLHDGRVEVMCRTPGYRIRVSAPEEQAWEAVELFERWTHLNVQAERRPRRAVVPMEGQLPLIELESEGNHA